MELPTKGSLADTRQIIEGKLSDLDHEPMSVQVLIHEECDGAEFVSLMDVSWARGQSFIRLKMQAAAVNWRPISRFRRG